MSLVLVANILECLERYRATFKCVCFLTIKFHLAFSHGEEKCFNEKFNVLMIAYFSFLPSFPNKIVEMLNINIF